MTIHRSIPQSTKVRQVIRQVLDAGLFLMMIQRKLLPGYMAKWTVVELLFRQILLLSVYSGWHSPHKSAQEAKCCDVTSFRESAW